MRILIYAPGDFRPGGTSGGRLVMLRLAGCVAARGHEVTILCRPVPAEQDQEIRNWAPGCAVVRHEAPLDALEHALAERTAEVMLLTRRPQHDAAIAACRRARMPLAVYVIDAEAPADDAPHVRDPGTLTLALSRFLAARLAARDGLAAEVLAPIIDPERQRSEGPRDTVLFVNPIPQKGWAIAVAVAERLRDTRFIVLESWPLTETWRQHWLERIAGLGNIEWRAAVADMRPIWARTRVLLMPSLWEEGWGMVASEAQVSGIPVVASHRGGLPEAVGPGGVILDADAPAAQWAGAVSRLMTDDGQHAAVAAAARRHAARPELRPDAVAGRFLSLVSAHAERYRRGTVS